MLDETNLIDIGSAKPTWTSMWLPLFNGLLKSFSVERFFISLSTIPKFSVPSGNKPRIESVLISGVIHSHLFNLKQSLTCFGDKPLANLYSSVGRTCIFLWCTETELSIAKGSVKKNVLSLYLIRTQSLVWPIYLVV